MWTLPRIKIRRDFLPLQTIDLVHLRRRFVNESDECFRVCVFHLLPKSPNYSADMFRPWIPINSLRLDCPKSFNAPKVVPLWSEKQWIAIFKAPERWCMSREVFFHEVLTFIRGMSLCKVLFKDHIAVFCKQFSLVNRQTQRFFALQNVVNDDFLQHFLFINAPFTLPLK